MELAKASIANAVYNVGVKRPDADTYVYVVRVVVVVQDLNIRMRRFFHAFFSHELV